MLTVRGISKSFGSVVALDGVSASFEPGNIHGVLGENGAGKSTLMNILSGFLRPDSGEVQLDGKPLPLGSPVECKHLGIAMIHQHFTLVPGFTVEENLALAGLEGFGPLNQRQLAQPAIEQAEELGWRVEPASVTGQLPVGAQQRLEILKSIGFDSRVVVFDEPTAVLSPGEVEDLFRVLRALKAAGKVVIVIAHKLQEVMAIADRVTVLRRGRVVADAEITGVDASQLAHWMVGELPEEVQKGITTDLGPGIEARGLSARGDRDELAVRGIDFSVGRGEILGIGGVDGNGQVELAEVLAGIRPYDGSVDWQSGEPSEVRVSYIPQDRQTDGLALSMTVEDNLLIEGHRRPDLVAGPFIRRRRVREWAKQLAARFDIRTGSLADLAGSLSGGNQQKVVVARALDKTPDLLVAVNPSRGLDVKATEFVHRQILAARDAGAAVVLISTDLDELASLSTRTLFLSRGELVSGDGPEAVVGGLE